MKKITLTLILTLFSCLSFSQIKYSGSIETPEKDTLIGGQFAIYSVDDTTFLKGDIIENNQFDFTHGKKPFFIKVFSVAHKDSFVLVNPEPENGKYAIPTIKLLSKEQLGQVTVRASRTMFTRSLKGIKVNVASTPLAELETLFDVLKASPKIMSPDDESIQIIGKGTPTIYVDRQEILTMDELKAIPATFVDKIDIITNPSARYSASGAGGVIEVYTMNYHMEGSVTSIGLNGGINTLAQPNLGANINLNFKRKKFSLNFNVNGSFSKYKNPSSSRTEYTDDSGILTQSEAQSFGTHFWVFSNLKMRYEFNSKHSLTAGIRGWGGGNNGGSDGTQDFLQHTNLNQSQITNGKNGNVWINPTAHLNYKFKTDSAGSYFSTRFQYNVSIRDGRTENTSRFYDYADTSLTAFDRKTDSRDRPHVFTTFIDYVHIFDTTGWELAVGGFHSGLINDKIYNQYNLEDQTWTKDNQFSNSYNYTENVAALYVDMEKEWSFFSMKLGIRTEGTFINGFSQALNQKIIDTMYFNVFPSATFMFTLGKKKNWTIATSYTARIDRPKFENYDPFIRQPDSTTITYGNPNLLPEYSHNVSLEFGYGYGYSLEVFYSRTNREISSRSFVDSNTYISHTTPDNALYVDEIGADFSIPINLKWWRGYNSIFASYQKYYFPQNFFRAPFGNVEFGVHLYEQFFLPKDWSINTNVRISSWADANIISNVQVYWSAGIAKKFLDGDLNVRFDVNNIVPPKNRSTYYGGNYFTESNYQWAFTTFKVSIRYKFGRLKAVQHIEDAKKGGQSDRL